MTRVHAIAVPPHRNAAWKRRKRQERQAAARG